MALDWCCMCGKTKPDPREKCPVSAVLMQPAAGLNHLLANKNNKKAQAIYEEDAPIRKKLGITND